MNTKRLVSIVMELIITSTLMLAEPPFTSDGTISDQGVSSEVVLAHELVHAVHAQVVEK